MAVALIEGPAIWAEGEPIADDQTRDHGLQAAGAIEAEELTRFGFGVLRITHGAGPEPTLVVAPAVIEAVVGMVEGRRCHQLQ